MMELFGIRASFRRTVTIASIALMLVMLSGCAPSTAGEGGMQENVQPGETEVSWSANASCDACHALEEKSMSNAVCLASLHDSMDCKSCHLDVAGLATVHEGKTSSSKVPKKLKATDVSDDLCLSCHGGSWEKLAEATSEVALSDSEGNARNPHDRGEVQEHQTLTCYDCHQMHEEGNVNDSAMKQCESCHHAGVFECGTCHE